MRFTSDQLLSAVSCTHLLLSLSFVVGSDGYVYEGRGWNVLGTHTRGRNSIGYGVSIIGNYTATLPSRHAMDLLRHRLVQCAVNRGALIANFTIHGHRQVVNYTSCPGDALFSEIRSWKHFREWQYPIYPLEGPSCQLMDLQGKTTAAAVCLSVFPFSTDPHNMKLHFAQSFKCKWGKSYCVWDHLIFWGELMILAFFKIAFLKFISTCLIISFENVNTLSGTYEY